MSALFTKVVLDRPWRIRYSNRTIYRIQTLDKPLDLAEIGNPQRSLATLSQWLWACLDEPNPFETPEDLAERIDLNRSTEITQALLDCVNMGEAKTGNAKKDEKKDDSLTQSPSPTSS
jgi:hypothetical protein